MPGLKIVAQETLDGIGHIIGGTTIADRPREARMLAHRAAQAEVIGVLGPAVSLDLLAFQADIGDAMLAATVGTAGYIELQLLIKFRQALFKFLDQPARERLGFSDGQLAELTAGAGDSATPEGRSRDMQTGSFQRQRDRRSVFARQV